MPRPPRASPDDTDQPQAPPKPPEPSTPEANKERGYVYKDDNGWHARCPYNTELHARYKWQENATKPHWWDNLLTIRLPLPIGNRKEIVPRILENLLPHRKKPYDTFYGLAADLGVGRHTIARAVETLRMAGKLAAEPVKSHGYVKGFKLTVGKTTAASVPVDFDAEGPPPDPYREVKIKRKLDATKKFLSDQPDLTNRITEVINDGTMLHWVASGKVSEYYLVMSPLVARSCDLTKLEKDLPFCAQVYTQHITEPIKEYFRELFQAEYN